MVSGTGASPSPEQLQDLLLESPGFTEFLLGLTTISATLLGGTEPMLCAITVERDGTPATVASSGEDARLLDEKQYTFDDGPCLTALRQGTTVLVPDVANDDRWDHYASAVSGEGIRSVLAVPIATDPGSAAALNCYSRTSGVFDEATVAEVERHAASISRILRLALKVHPPQIYPEHLRSALKSRAIIDAAVALIMVQNRCSRERAMELLHLASRATDTRLHTIAADILQGAALPPADPPE
ncbi:GAF and ANTAR domain-containing protein [Arthrobacter sp. U41]|uniref:GAF and ANTAR domain-containing protein n=1 Tax=Arthrobacter sp. U41 TaxID=1849032 RepID=UPI0008594F02|nr:GAF and ANTAR domain-containing protein [Arthrobacter sp. U41]AOT02179.1 antitermination regulator [Arthrobacter sp. U41]